MDTATTWTTPKGVEVGDEIKPGAWVCADGRAINGLWRNRASAEADPREFVTVIAVTRGRCPTMTLANGMELEFSVAMKCLVRKQRKEAAS